MQINQSWQACAFIQGDKQVKIGAWLLFGCTMQAAAHAADLDQVHEYGKVKTSPAARPLVLAGLARNTLPSTRNHLIFGDARRPDRLDDPTGVTDRESPFSLALGNAAKRGLIAVSVEAYTDVLIQCQRKRSPAATTPLMRSDSQQAHCFRF
jgi:hypothetical protein